MPLHSLQVERHVLGGLIQNQDAIAEIEGFVSEKDFVAQPHSTIFSCLKNAYLAKEQIDKVILAQKIKNLGISFKDSINIFDYIDGISFAPITKQATVKACQELVKLRGLRDIESTCEEIKAHVNNSANQPFDKTIAEVDAIYGNKISSFSTEEVDRNMYASLLDLAEERGNNPVEEVGYATPFPEFNRLYGGFRRKNLYIIASRAKAGKALEENTPILTPSGFRKIKDLKSGDFVFSVDGKPTKVVATARWENRNLYEVTSCDGQSVICDEAHEWQIKKRSDYKWEIVDTKALHLFNMDQSKNKRPQTPFLPKAEPVFFPEAQLPIDPYILGLWLGDGTSSGPAITNADDFIVEKIHEFAELRSLSVVPNGKFKGKKNTFNDDLKKLNLIDNKHIPQIYLFSSPEQRIKLLQGLIDSDGLSKRNGRVEFCNKNKTLAEQTLFVIHSLGEKASIRKNNATLYGKNCGFRYRVCFNYEQVALLPRKRDTLKMRKEKSSNRHIKAKPCGTGNTVCIEVEHDSHLFLCGEGMMPTHNSTILNHLGSEMSFMHSMPILFLDTEMSTEETQFRAISAKTGVPMWYVETGNWRRNPEMVNKIRNHLKSVAQKYNVTHKFIGNKKIEEIESICRRWYLRSVGRGGKCMIVFDYIKAVDKLTGSQQEYQLMGDKVDALKKLAGELDLPIVTAVQNNRSGITTNKGVADLVDDESSVGISDRITWYATYVGLFRRRVADEITLDTPESGTHKLIELVSRFQGKDAAGHQDLIKRKFPNGDEKWVKNFINFDIKDFRVEERGSLKDCITRQNAQFLVQDPHSHDDHTL